MKIFLALAFLVTAVILLVFFRSFYAVLFPMIVVIVGVVWSFGTLDIFGYKITLLTSLIAPLIIVIGIPNCILLLNKYQQEYARHGNKIKSFPARSHASGCPPSLPMLRHRSVSWYFTLPAAKFSWNSGSSQA
jgi:predicted RND superfamily exporter protein